MNKQTFITVIIMWAIAITTIIIHCRTMSEEKQHDIPIDTPHPLIPIFTDVMVLFFLVLFGYLVEALLTNYNIETPYGFFMVIFSFFWGILAFRNEVVYLASHFIHMSASEMLYIYKPVLVFHHSFCLDVFIFLKTLPQVLVIGGPVSFVTGCFFGLLIMMIIAPEWELEAGILFGILCTPIGPAKVVQLLKQRSSRTRHISVLLEGEAVICFIIADIIHKLTIVYIEDLTVHWYQFTCLLLRFILLGILAGYVFGAFGRYLIRKMYTDNMSVFVICFVLPFLTYAISEKYIAGCGSMSVMVIGIMLAMERTALNKNIDLFLTTYWELFSFVLDIVVLCMTPIYLAVYVIPHMESEAYILIVVAYVVYYVMRFVCFLLYSPIISRLGYGIDLKGMLVCVWGGVKSPFSLIICLRFIETVKEILIENEEHKFFFYILGIYCLSIFINGTFSEMVINFLGLSQISLARQANMNNCMKHIFNKRERTMAILKMERFLTDVNWSYVIEATNMQHPYHLEINDEEDDAFFLGYRFTTCPDCKKELVQEPTQKEMKEMQKEAKMRILKAKKMSFSRQFENGMITKEGIRILSQAVELAMDSPETEIELDGLQRRFEEESCLHRFCRKRLEAMQKRKPTPIKPPRRYWRRVCFHIVTNTLFDKIMLFIILFDLVFTTIDIYYHPSLISKNLGPPHGKEVDGPLVAAHIILAFCYISEFVMKILAYSWIRICGHGFRRYFSSIWNTVDFLVMVGYLLGSSFSVYDLTTPEHITSQSYQADKFRQSMDIIQLFRFIRLLRVFEIYYPSFIKCLNQNADQKMSFTYELGKSYATGETEILDMLPYMIDNKKIRDDARSKIENDRVIITKLLGIVQKERPWVAITVKTKQAIRTVLSSMNEAMNQLKIAGWVDDYEQEKLEFAMENLYKKVNAIKMVQPSAPKVIFKEVAWMAADETVIDFLFENVTVKKFEPGEVVFEEGDVADGIYIVVTGLFMITYYPRKSILDSLHEFGILPIVDYLSGTKYEEPSVDYIVSGNCIGELSTLTNRAYNCTIVADAHSQVYVLSHGIIKRAMELSPDPVVGLECRIWKEASIRIAVPLLLSIPAYQTFSQDQIKYALERAFLPNLNKFKIFAVTDMIQDIILIDGIVADFNTRETYVAPCCIPRTVQKVILPTSSLMNLPFKIESKLLIIPEKDVDEYDVMMLADETCEMISLGSSQKCLQHTIQQRSRLRRRQQRMRGTPSGKAARMPDALSSISSSISQYTSNVPGSEGTMVFKVGSHASFVEDEDKTAADYFRSDSALKRRQTLSAFE